MIACGGRDDTGHGQGHEADADTDADADQQTTAVITTASSDYSTGSFAAVSLSDWSVTDEIFVTAGDSVVASDEGWVFQLNRYTHDTVRLYEPGSWREPLWEQDVGELSNPHDAELCGGALFVSLYGRDFIGVYDLASGTLEGTVDLSAFSDGDDVGPEASALVEVDGKLYAGLNRLNREDGWVSVGGAVVEIDCDSLSVSGAWDVGGNTNIYAWPGTGKLLVGAEAHGEDVAGLYALDPSAGSAELLVDSGTEGLSGVVAHGDDAVAISLASDYSSYAIHCIDLSSGALATVETTSSYLTGAVGNDAGEAWISSGSSWIEPGAPSGVFVYDVATCSALTTAPISLSLYPFSMAFY